MIQNSRNHEVLPNNFISADARYCQLQECLRFGIPHLDDVVRLYPGSLTLIQGNLPRTIVRTLITQLTISLLLTNAWGELAFVDGANLFPYYEISQEARKYGLNPLAILDRIQLSRAFNYHQMTEILSKKLPQLLETNPIRIVLIPQISSLHLSKEALQYLEYDKLTATSSILELTQAVGRLKSLSLEYDLVGIMTAESAPHSNHKALGGTFLAHTATDVIRVAATPDSKPTNYTLILTVQKGGPEIQIKLSHEEERERTQSIPLTRFW